jgi:tetrahydromethanopterin S-methyltransferase subunit G
MTKDRTPPSKRIEREETSSSDWKMKAIQRREENELLKERLENLEGKVSKFEGRLNQAIDKSIVDDLKRQLEIANKIIAHQQKEILELKKKPR